MSKKIVRTDEKKSVFSYVESLGLKVDESTAQDSTKRIGIGIRETAIIEVSKVVYDSEGYKGEIKAVRVEGVLRNYSKMFDLEDVIQVNNRVYWDSNASEAKAFFGTMLNQKTIPKKLIAIHRQDKYSWYICEIN